MTRYLLALLLLLASSAYGDQGVQRITPDASLVIQGQVLSLSAPVCNPAAGSYSVAYRNSIATGCTLRSVGGSDDTATLVFSGGSAATYTMPQSSVTTFTGSISGTTLTTPTNAVTIGSVITGVGVIDNTYVTAGSGTSWTVNNSQTVGSRTLTQSVFPPGHGTCFKNNGTALLTLTATTSTLYGAAGVVNGTPSTPGGATVLYPGGEACLQADPSNNYAVLGFLPGSWVQSAGSSSPVSSFQWTGLSGYPRLHLSCMGLGSIGSSGRIQVQLAYGGTFQASGYSYQAWYNDQSSTVVQVYNSLNDSFFPISGFQQISLNVAADVDIDFSFSMGTGTGYANTIKSTVRDSAGGSGGTEEEGVFLTGSGPLTTTASVTGIQLYLAPGTFYGNCWLTPRTGNGP